MFMALEGVVDLNFGISKLKLNLSLFILSSGNLKENVFLKN